MRKNYIWEILNLIQGNSKVGQMFFIRIISRYLFYLVKSNWWLDCNSMYVQRSIFNVKTLKFQDQCLTHYYVNKEILRSMFDPEVWLQKDHNIAWSYRIDCTLSWIKGEEGGGRM